MVLTHVPPDGVPVSVLFNPIQVAVPPEILGRAFTVKDAVVALTGAQPVLVTVNVYTPEFPVTTPVTPVFNKVGAIIDVPPGPDHA